MNKKLSKFETFDALRFFAFFKVFLFHIPIVSFPVFNFIKNGGGSAVCFFFSLSGFLITYLILEEKKQTGRMNLHNFFLRRALRIWPLYYLMLLFAFLSPTILSFISLNNSGEGYKPDWIMSIFFLENYKMILTDSFANVSPLGVMWSLCVEEHFYFIWGIAFFFIPLRKIYVFIGASIILAIIARYVFYLNGWSFLDIFTNLDYFAYGAIPAVLFSLFKESITKFLSKISDPIKISVLFIALSIVFVFPNIYFRYKELIEPSILGLTFCSIIILIVFENQKFCIGSTNIFSVLGTFTYSLYLTHTIVINLFIKLFEKMELSLTSPSIALLFVLITFSITIAASMLSYYLIEKPFLKLKNKCR